MTAHRKLRETYDVRVERRSVIGNSPFVCRPNRPWVLFSAQPSMREAQEAVRRALTKGPDSWDYAKIVHTITFEKA